MLIFLKKLNTEGNRKSFENLLSKILLKFVSMLVRHFMHSLSDILFSLPQIYVNGTHTLFLDLLFLKLSMSFFS